MATTVAHPARRKPAKKSKDAREALNMRIKPMDRRLIDHAAELTGKNRTDFVLDAARQAAQSALLDRSTIPVNEKSHAAFKALLDAQPSPNARLRKSLQTPAVWE